MNRYNQLSRLKDEIGRLFADGIDEKTIFERLHADPYFATASHNDFQSFFNHMKKKDELEQQHNHLRVDMESKIGKAERKIRESERIKKLCQNADDHLLYDADAEEYVYIWSIWQNRFSLNLTQNGNTDKIKMLDWYQCETKTIDIPKVGYNLCTRTLTYPFLLFIDTNSPTTNTIIRLAHFNAEEDSIQITQTIDYFHLWDNIFLDSCNSSKFVLMFEGDQMQICNLINGQIQLDEMRDKNENLLEMCVSYFEDHIYDYQNIWNEDADRLIGMEVFIWDLINDVGETVELDLLPDNLVFAAHFDEDDYSCCQWNCDRLFVTVEFVLTNAFGIVYADLQREKWTSVNFATNHPICYMHLANDKNLLVQTKEDDKDKIYKLSMRKPDLLRNMAWLKLVNLYKQAKDKDPYAEARRYLPFNSDIQRFVFTKE